MLQNMENSCVIGRGCCKGNAKVHVLFLIIQPEQPGSRLIMDHLIKSPPSSLLSLTPVTLKPDMVSFIFILFCSYYFPVTYFVKQYIPRWNGLPHCLLPPLLRSDMVVRCSLLQQSSPASWFCSCGLPQYGLHP